MWIIGPIIQILIAGVVFGALLQIASKIVLKDSIEFGDAFRTAIVAELNWVTRVLVYLLKFSHGISVAD